MYCKKCGSEIRDNMKFCAICGSPVDTDVSRDARENQVDNFKLDIDFGESPEKIEPIDISALPEENTESVYRRNTASRTASGSSSHRSKALAVILVILMLIVLLIIAFIVIKLTGSRSSSDVTAETSGSAGTSGTSAAVIYYTPSPTEDADASAAATPTPSAEISVTVTTPEPTVSPSQPSATSALSAIDDPTAYLLPDSSSRYLSESDISSLSQKELCLARNEIFARHGRLFKTEEIAAYFEGKTWYSGTVAPSNFDDSVLNQYEIANINLIANYEKSVYGGSYY